MNGQQYHPARHAFNNRNYNQQGNQRFYPRKNSDGGDAYWCETCDRGFPNFPMLEKHKLQHQTCNIDGCKFVAHPKVITKHIQMQHSSGLFKKISNLQNPEDIKKWIEERKKKYPTKNNVEKKAAELKEKIERGEKMGLKWNNNIEKKSYGNRDKRKCEFDKQNLRKNKRVRLPYNNNPPSQQNNVEKDILMVNNKFPQSRKFEQVLSKPEDCRKLKPFSGIRNLVWGYAETHDSKEEQFNYIIEDEDDVLQKSSGKEPTICSALSCLIENYGSDEDIDATNLVRPEEKSKLKNIKLKGCIEEVVAVQPVLLKESETICNKNNESDNDNGPEEVKIVKNSDIEINSIPEKPNLSNGSNNLHSKQKPNEKHFKRNVITKKSRPKLPSTLLQKLLQNEIRHERNTVLQCIRYIIQNNYFDK